MRDLREMLLVAVRLVKTATGIEIPLHPTLAVRYARLRKGMRGMFTVQNGFPTILVSESSKYVGEVLVHELGHYLEWLAGKEYGELVAVGLQLAVLEYHGCRTPEWKSRSEDDPYRMAVSWYRGLGREMAIAQIRKMVGV